MATKEELVLEDLLSKTDINRYELVQLAAYWSKELKRKEDAAGNRKDVRDFITQAMTDVLSKKVSREDIQKLLKAQTEEVVSAAMTAAQELLAVKDVKKTEKEEKKEVSGKKDGKKGKAKSKTEKKKK
ncbi:MAG: hypothetical protein WC955_09735 [Elusimicrobiota bacterium]